MKTFRSAAITAAAVLGVASGGYGIASAGSQPAPTEVEADDVQDPRLDGSIQIDDIEGETEEDENARLAGAATITEEDAAAAALAAHPGEVTESELGNENGTLVWEFEITRADGSTVDVKVDAGDGSALAADTDDDSADSDRDDVQYENEHDGDDDPDEDHED